MQTVRANKPECVNSEMADEQGDRRSTFEVVTGSTKGRSLGLLSEGQAFSHLLAGLPGRSVKAIMVIPGTIESPITCSRLWHGSNKCLQTVNFIMVNMCGHS